LKSRLQVSYYDYYQPEAYVPSSDTYIEKELKYSKIKLGPKCDDIDFVAPYIKHVDRNIEVTKSQISYR